jgi:hypothetical protein
LAATLIGVLLAITSRRLDIPPPMRYAWEDEGEDHEDGQSSHGGTDKEVESNSAAVAVLAI